MKVFHPHIRKHMLEHISYGEFIFLNAVLIAILSFIYTYVYKKEDIYNISSLSLIQYTGVLFLAAITVISSLIVFKLQENGIVTTSFILKMVPAVMMLVVGIFFFQEMITPKQLAGIFLAILAIMLLKGE